MFWISPDEISQNVWFGREEGKIQLNLMIANCTWMENNSFGVLVLHMNYSIKQTVFVEIPFPTFKREYMR